LIAIQTLISFRDDDFTARVVHNEHEVCILSESGFELVCDFGSDVPGAPAVHKNSIYHNSKYGVWNVASPNPPLVVDATNNWWGHWSGPHHATSWLYLGKPYGPHLGTGDSVTDYVLYDAWVNPAAVGGEWAPITLQTLTPINAVQLLAPWIALALIAAASTVAAYRRLFKKHW
jgi:hypothetical protein